MGAPTTAAAVPQLEPITKKYVKRLQQGQKVLVSSPSVYHTPSSHTILV